MKPVLIMFAALMVSGLIACDPDRAPYAPDCNPETCPNLYVRDGGTPKSDTKAVTTTHVEDGEDVEKHGTAIHTSGIDSIPRTLFAQYSLESETCNPGPDGWPVPCLTVDGKWYTSQTVDANSTSRTRSLVNVTVRFGWNGLSPSTLLPVGTFFLCDDWATNCSDLSRLSFSSPLPGVRQYTVIRGGTWGPGQYKIFTLWVRPQGGFWPKFSPTGELVWLQYRD